MATLKSFADLASFPVKTPQPEKPAAPIAEPGQSASSRIKEWLLSHKARMAYYSSQEIVDNVGVTFGAASGFMAKLVIKGVATKHGKRNGSVIYAITVDEVEQMHVRRTPSNGSVKGTTKTTHRNTSDLPIIPTTPSAKPYNLVAALLEAAAFAETVVPLQNYTTEQLIDEIHRRVHAGEK